MLYIRNIYFSGGKVGKTLFQKIWEIHKIKDLNDGSSQLFIGLHLIHEVTSPQAFFMLR